MSDTTDIQLGIRIPKKMYDELQDEAERSTPEGGFVNVSLLVRQFIIRGLRKRKAERERK